METENAPAPPKTRRINGPTQHTSGYDKSQSQTRYGELVDESAKMVRPVMMNLGELLEALFLAKGQKPDLPIHRCVDRTMGFIFSCIWDGEVNNEKHSNDQGILDTYMEYLNHEELSKKSWRELWGDNLHLCDMPLTASAKELLSYAYDGDGPYNYYRLFDETVTHEEYVRRLVEAAKAAVATVGIENPAMRPLSTVLLAAECRLALDEGRDVAPEQLAALARIEIKSMRNALAPSSGSGLKMRDGAIAAESAVIWLHARGNYAPTWWYDEKLAAAPVEPLAGEVLFVPFASGDIEFHPVKCCRDGKYTVGPKGTEQTFTDYRAALDCLARMKPASYWKHPNKANNWGTVTAVGFGPRTARELGLELAEGSEK